MWQKTLQIGSGESISNKIELLTDGKINGNLIYTSSYIDVSNKVGNQRRFEGLIGSSGNARFSRACWAVDLTRKNKIYINNLYCPNMNGTCYVGVLSSDTTGNYSDATGWIKKVGTFPTGTSNYDIDVSDLEGIYFLTIQVYKASIDVYLDIEDIYIE